MRHLILANQKRWCTSKLGKMTIGTKLLNTTGNCTNSSKRKPNRRRCSTRQSFEGCWASKCNNLVTNVIKNYKMIGSIWMIWTNNLGWKTKLSRNSPIKKDDISNKSTKRGPSSNRHCWTSGKWIENQHTSITMRSWNKIRRRSWRSRASGLNYSKQDFKQPKKMQKSTIKLKQKPNNREIKRKPSFRL